MSSHATYHVKTKIPTITCIPLTGTKQRKTPVKSSFKLHPHSKERKCVAITEPTEISTYTSNLNTAQHELPHLHKTYAHDDMQEIQHKIRTGDIKSTHQLALCKIPICQTCCEHKTKKQSLKRHQGSITAKDKYPGSGTSIDHVEAENVPGYTW
jgi:hypothetical protein